MNTFEEYLQSIGDEGYRAQLQKVLDWVKDSFPHLETRIAWNQPMFTDHGTFIIGFSVSKQHFAISPEAKGIARFSDEIVKAGYSHGSNIFRIKWSDPVDYSLLDHIIRFNMEDKADCAAFWRK